MKSFPSDFEVCIQGRKFLTVRDGQLQVNGADIASDVASVSRLIRILSGVMEDALVASAPAPLHAAPTCASSGNVFYLGRRQGKVRAK